MTAPALLPGAAGGFQLVVARRDILHQAVTNPAVIHTNQSFSTAASDPADGVAAMQGRFLAFNSYIDKITSGEVLCLLSSIGAPLMNCSTAGCNPTQLIEYATFGIGVEVLIGSKFGGVADLSQLQSGGYYSLLGMPWFATNQPPKTVEDRSWTPMGTNSQSLTVVLQANPKGWYDPVAADTVGGVDYRLYEIANRASVPWPVASNAGEGPSAAGDEACLAYQWISTNVTRNVGIKSLRATYTDDSTPFSSYSDNLGKIQYEPSLAPYFSAEVCNSVSNQLSLELMYVGFIQNLHGKLTSLVSDMATDQNSGLLQALKEVQGQVPAPASTVLGYSIDAVMRFITQVGAAIDPEPISKAALGVASSGLSLAMQKNKSASGSNNNKINATVADLAAEISANLNLNLEGLGNTFNEIVSDWSKLQEVGVLAQGPVAPGNGFAWQDGTSGLVLNSMLPAFEQSFFAALIPTIYQMVYFENVPFTNPHDYCYQHDCVTDRTTFCECVTGYYSPPSYDYFRPSGTSDIYVIATASNAYPTAAMMQDGLANSALVYLPDFFQGVGTGTGVVPLVQPIEWQNYLNPPGVCYGYLVPTPVADDTLELATRSEPSHRYQLDRSAQLGGHWTPAGESVVA